MIRVVSGIARDRDTVLMGLRRKGAARPGLWELPGGKVERNETSQGALIREWREELDVEVVVVGPLIAAATFEVEQAILVELYPIKLHPLARPRALAHDELQWVNPFHAVMGLPCSPGFYLHYRQIRALMQIASDDADDLVVSP